MARYSINRAKNKDGLLDEVRSLEEWAHSVVTWKNAMPPDAKKNHLWYVRTPPIVYIAQRFKGAKQIAVALKACEVIAVAMETSSYFGHSVGTVLGYSLDNGMLLADVHQHNVGQVKRKDNAYEPIWVITDPGHAVFLEEL